MKYAFFAGCKIPFHLQQSETSARAVLRTLNVELEDLEFNCCGYPVRHQHETAAIFAAARNMALAHKKGCNILTVCQCCYGQLKFAAHWLIKDQELRKEINGMLATENLIWEKDIQVKHLLSVLYHDIGPDALRAYVKKPLSGLKVAAHYGCHALRPGNVVRFDNPMAPTIFENLLALTGAQPIDWHRRLECCGHPLFEKNTPLALHLMKKKLQDAENSGADLISTACTYCQIQFDSVRSNAMEDMTLNPNIPAVLFSQLLGFSFGLEEKDLGLTKNAIDCQKEFRRK